MRRRKDIASLLRNIERPLERNTTIGVASSIAGDGSIVNGQNLSNSEVRDLDFVLPYGISSSGISGIRIQIITNDNNNNVAVGVIDKNRPKVRPGCITIYDKYGSSISLNGDGSIAIKADAIDIDSNITIGGDISINGNISINGSMTINGKLIE